MKNNGIRVTKYNPKYRNMNGEYLNQEWTSFSDVWKIVWNDEYLDVENKYIHFIEKVLGIVKITNLTLIELEDNSNFWEVCWVKLSNNTNYSSKECLIISRNILREKIWWKLIWNNWFYLHFWYDYYMYFWWIDDNQLQQIIKEVKIDWIYIEEFESPYI